MSNLEIITTKYVSKTLKVYDLIEHYYSTHAKLKKTYFSTFFRFDI